MTITKRNTPGQSSLIVNSHRQGFSLIELLVSIAILAILSSITVASFRNGERRKSVSFASDIMINAVRNAQNFSLTSKQIPNSNCQVGGTADKAAKSYLVYIVPSNGTALYGIDKCDAVIQMETHNLPANTRIKSNLLLNGSAVSALQIKFTPPFASISVSNNFGANQGTFSGFTNANFSMELQDGSVSKTVTIDGISGKIGE